MELVSGVHDFIFDGFAMFLLKYRSVTHKTLPNEHDGNLKK